MSDALDQVIADLNANRPWPNVPYPAPSFPLIEQPELTLCAMAAWGEMRSMYQIGMLMCLQTVRNRFTYIGRSWYGREATFKSQLLFPWAYSCFNENDPNRTAMLNPLAHDTEEAWEEACAAAYDVVNHRDRDLTDGATHYHTAAVHPKWNTHTKMVRTVALHRPNRRSGADQVTIFYREEV